MVAALVQGGVALRSEGSHGQQRGASAFGVKVEREAESGGPASTEGRRL